MKKEKINKKYKTKEPKINIFRQIYYMHYIAIAIIICSLLLTAFVFRQSFLHNLQAIVDCALSFAYYFCVMFSISHNIKEYVLFPNIHKTESTYIPQDTNNFVLKLQMFWQSFLCGETYAFFLDNTGLVVLIFSQLLLLLIPLGVLVKKIFNVYLSRTNNNYNKNSRILTCWIKFSNKYYKPMLDWCSRFLDFFKHVGNGIYLKLFIIVWLINLNVTTIIIEVLAMLFYFVSSFNFGIMYKMLLRLCSELELTITALPVYLWLVVFLPLFQWWRHKHALKRARHNESKNKRLIENLPITTLVCGPMGCGKTTHVVDFTLSMEVLFREKALSILNKYDLMFSTFPWINFENALQFELKEKRCYNLATVRSYVDACRARFESEQFFESIFDYDFLNNKMIHDNKLNIIDIFDALKIYAQAYFIYICMSSLVISNLGIRLDNLFMSQGNFPLWDSDFFARDSKLIRENSRLSHILNWDTLRLGRKFTEDKSNNSLEFGVFTVTEIFKDRGNQYETKGLKKDDDTTNQVNDRFNWTIKTCRHAATVDNFPFFRLISDDQRENSGPADLVSLMDVLRIDREKKQGVTFPFFYFDGFFCDWWLFVFGGMYSQYRYSRGDNTLLMYFLHWLGAKTANYSNSIQNLYGYRETRLAVLDGKDGEKIEKTKYYLQDKKIYSNRFDTACYRDFFARRAEKSGIGIDDIATYKDVTANLDELRTQQSYMMKELDSITSVKSED